MRTTKLAIIPSILSSILSSIPFAAVLLLGCDSTSPSTGPGTSPQIGTQEWFEQSTASLNVSLSVPTSSAIYPLPKLKEQLAAYDPGAVLRCSLGDDEAFRTAVDAAGGVQWGYGISVLADESQPIFRKGRPVPYVAMPGMTNDAAGAKAAVEIAKADIVGLTSEAALYYTPGHGIMVFDLTGPQPVLRCGAKLPGQVEKFYFYQNHLIAMVENWIYGAGHRAFLFHFRLDGTTLGFVESVELGNVNILDTRRFNAELVIYGSLTLDPPPATASSDGAGTLPPSQGVGRISSGDTREHRTLRVFHIGNTLEPRMNDTLLDSRTEQARLVGGLDPNTPIGTEVSRWDNFNANMWASDHYFTVTESISRTILSGWVTQWYSVCTKSHTEPRPYRSCSTKYETRPNPDYVPPDNSGGDRSCNGASLRDCLRTVVRVSSPTIQVPVSIECIDTTYDQWFCDAYESKSYTYPTFRYENATKLFIYEYTDSGFVRLSDQAQMLDTTALGNVGADAKVAKLSFNPKPAELLLQGQLQTLQFQNGYLYAISDGELRTFAIEGGSLVQTSQVRGTSNTLQTALFTDTRLYLSDYHYGSWSGGPTSVLRVFDLSNPAFPQQASTDLSLPGGHDAILPVDAGILTIGSVERFEGQTGPWLKLGLFADPFASEKSYLVLGTDLRGPRASVTTDVTYYLDSVANRLFLPYSGSDPQQSAYHAVSRVSVSHITDGTLVSDGAITLPETPERVRPIPGKDNQVLTFAPNSIHLLTPGSKDWQSTAVFTFFRPQALYHPTKGEQYIELSRLGDQCKLYLTTRGTINRRESRQFSSSFDCAGYGVRAYANNLLLGNDNGIRFTINANPTDTPISVAPLSKDQIAEITDALKARPTCILNPSTADDSPIDWSQTPDLSHVRCFTPDELASFLKDSANAGGRP